MSLRLMMPTTLRSASQTSRRRTPRSRIARSVVVGRRLHEGYAELRDRRTGERHDVALADVPGVIKKSLGYRTGNGREV